MKKSNNLLTKNEIELLGTSLNEIEQKLLKQAHPEGLKRIWFQGDEPYFDIFFDVKNDEIIWFQFTLRGKSLSWNSKLRKFQTGLTNELQLDDVSFYAATKTIENDEKLDVDFINLVKSILQIRSEDKIFVQALLLFD
ncbi:hypothetical protein [Brunnivagina elsteri]|uniref:Uncharacterized protein n=1 Tax=Brunnivagina elsteri CCALA 953 TaxID=987040 RepID=A0A2A2TDG2_9CYAN|nr:hypothetical protein [Calothrix elsteri]PAX51790.1 hypothetical protein CK510_22900 [Calothrix elsteri CCALA 953]